METAPKYVGAYAEQDAVMTLRLWERMKIELDTQDLWSIFNLETSLIPLMLDMRTNGVRVDLDKADRVKKGLQKKIKELKAFIKDKSSVDVDPWASASVRKCLRL